MEDKSLFEAQLNRYPKPVTIEGITKILEQLKKAICKLYINKGEKKGTGFFCNINLKNKSINTLISNFHIINSNYINNNKKIIFSINDDSEIKVIKIEPNDKREIYYNEKNDITIIEIINNDNIKNVNYLKLDEKIFLENSINYYEGKSIYDLSYHNGGKASVSYGLLKEICNNNNINNLIHLCSTDKGSSGSPLLNLENYKVIGIHCGDSKFQYNRGIFLKYPFMNLSKK